MARVTPNPHVRLAVLLSGAGRTLANIRGLIARKRLSASVEVVVSTRGNVGGVEQAREAHIPYHIVRPADLTPEEFGNRVTESLAGHSFDLVLMAGFLRHWPVPPQYEGKVMNIHPSLLPVFGGKGMYGNRVHQAVLDAGVKVSGCTVHFVNNEFDAGPIIVQRACPVLENDTADSLAARVFVQECIAYPSAIRLFAQGRLRIEGRRVRVLPDTSPDRESFVLDDED